MVQATTKYNDALKGMILDLNRTYSADPAGQEAIDDYVAALATIGQFDRAVVVEAGEAISHALEKMVESLIGEDMHYSIEDWRAQWKDAVGTAGSNQAEVMALKKRLRERTAENAASEAVRAGSGLKSLRLGETLALEKCGG